MAAVKAAPCGPPRNSGPQTFEFWPISGKKTLKKHVFTLLNRRKCCGRNMHRSLSRESLSRESLDFVSWVLCELQSRCPKNLCKVRPRRAPRAMVVSGLSPPPRVRRLCALAQAHAAGRTCFCSCVGVRVDVTVAAAPARKRPSDGFIDLSKAIPVPVTF